MLILGAVNILHLFLLLGLIIAGFILLFWDIKVVLLRLIPVNIFCGMLCITIPLGGGSFNTFIWYALRINAAAVLYMLFIIPLGIGGLAAALAKLKTPAKLISLLILTYRYLFVMYERVFLSILSIRLRRPRQSTAMSWRSYTAVFASALISALFRAQKVYLAMQSRGFNGVFPITRVFKWKIQDTITFFTALLMAILLLLIDKRLGGTR
jgi:cobalt/nickel transport system permease protein